MARMTEKEMMEEMVNLATGQPIRETPTLPHVDKAQLTIAHLQACVQKAEEGSVSIDLRILENYKNQRTTIMGIASSKDAIGTIEQRLGDFVESSLQQSPSTPQPKPSR